MQMISSSLPPLSDEQRAKIAANRARALELQVSFVVLFLKKSLFKKNQWNVYGTGKEAS